MEQLANSLQQLAIPHETAAIGVQQAVTAVANLPPPDQVFQQQVLQLLANIQQEMANTCAQQQQMANVQQQMQADIGALRLEVRASTNAFARLTNSRLSDSMPLLWLYNDQGQLPGQPAISRETSFDVNAQVLNELLQHYGLLQQAQGLEAFKQRFMLLRHLGATPGVLCAH